MGLLAIIVFVIFNIFTEDLAFALIDLGRMTQLEFIYHAGKWIAIDDAGIHAILSAPFWIMIAYFGAKAQVIRDGMD